jgi:hypothetical protein
MADSIELHKMASGDLVVWLDSSGTICLKTLEKHGDPVELSEDEALQLAAVLTRLAAESRG